MTKHCDYDNPCKITITKKGEDLYFLLYESENFELYCSEDELIEELREHLALMKGEENAKN